MVTSLIPCCSSTSVSWEDTLVICSCVDPGIELQEVVEHVIEVPLDLSQKLSTFAHSEQSFQAFAYNQE